MTVTLMHAHLKVSKIPATCQQFLIQKFTVIPSVQFGLLYYRTFTLSYIKVICWKFWLYHDFIYSQYILLTWLGGLLSCQLHVHASRKIDYEIHPAILIEDVLHIGWGAVVNANSAQRLWSTHEKSWTRNNAYQQFRVFSEKFWLDVTSRQYSRSTH